MGLDMYLLGGTNDRDTQEIGYWRKHPNLHGYIVKHYAGGVDECQRIELTADDIQDILIAVEEGSLPETSGFFFGKSYGDETDRDVSILESTLKRMRNNPNYKVYYQASW